MNKETEQVFLPNADTNQPSTSTQKPDEAGMPGTSQANDEDDEDMSHVCRTCASVTEFVVPIFSGEGLQNNLADKIHEHLPIRVRKSDVLPVVLCYQCASTLLAWHELVQCCVQADGALRQRVKHVVREAAKAAPSDLEGEELSKLVAFTQYLRTQDPPLYHDTRAANRSCTHCGTLHELDKYQDHLVDQHLDLLFLCQECNKYIDKTELIEHMSSHEDHYASAQDDEEKDRSKAKRKPRKKSERIDINQNTNELLPKVAINSEDATIQQNEISKESVNQRNEFSDHSDAESSFGPLPESVFEAIEDSRDSQTLDEDTSPLEDEQLSAESRVSTPTPATSVTNSDITTRTPSSLKTENLSDFVIPDSESSTTSCPSQDTNDSETELTSDSTKKPDRKIRTCAICGKSFTASSSFFYHMRYVHRGVREHECQVCSRRFATKDTLTSHMTIHSGHYGFECKHCKKLFKSKASVYIHEQSHSRKKTLKCNLCDAAFRWKTHLMRHIKRHEGEKKHVCSICGRGFSVRCDLLRHERTHTAGSFSCDECGVVFAQLRYLKVHTTKQHGKNI